MKNRKKSENTQGFPLPSLYKSPSAEVSYIEGLEHEALYSLFIVGLVVTAIIGVINGHLSIHPFDLLASTFLSIMASYIIIGLVIVEFWSDESTISSLILLALIIVLAINSTFAADKLITPYVKFLGIYSIVAFISGRILSLIGVRWLKTTEVSIRRRREHKASIRFTKKAVGIYEDKKSTDEEKLKLTLILIHNDISNLWDRTQLSEYKKGLQSLQRSIVSAQEIEDEELRASALSCVTKIIGVYYSGFLHLSSLYLMSDEDVINEKLCGSDSHERYLIVSEDIDALVSKIDDHQELKEVEKQLAEAIIESERKEDLRRYVDNVIKNI